MADLTKKFAKFFISEHTKFSDFENSLKESAVKNSWVEAVVLFRQGMKKLGENDMSGYDDIKSANEALKAVVTGGKDEVTQKATQLTESIEKFDKTKIDEQVESLKYQLGTLYDVLKENGMPIMEDEDEFFDDDLEDDEDDTPVATATAVVDPAAVPVSEKPVPIVVEVTAVPMTQPNNTAVPPSSEPTPVPPSSSPAVTPTEQPATQAAPSAGAVSAPTDSKSQPALPATEAAVRESAFEHGVLEARKRWKMGENSKNIARQIAEKELCEKSYSYVNRWMEGFNYGYGFEEQVKRDTDPKLFETETTETDKK